MRSPTTVPSILCVAVLPLLALAEAGAGAPQQAPGAFLEDSQAAMARMMAAMEVKPSGEADRDFVAMMVPHHQGAIDMAQAELRFGRNERLRRIAHEIIIEQQQEIAAMQHALEEEPDAR